MNPLVTNIALIAQPAEYFDKQTGAAWKLRNFFTNQLVWAAFSLKRMNDTRDTTSEVSLEALHQQMTLVSTLRMWVRDVSNTALTLDLTPANVGKTLGLDRQVDTHEEACRTARMKCQQLRSAKNFKQYYERARDAHEENMKQRRDAVEEITDLCSDQGYYMHGEFCHPNGTREMIEGFVSDEHLADDGAIEERVDRLAETLGNVLESLYDCCDMELSSAITVNKVSRLSGYMQSILSMMTIAGVDTKRLKQRREALNAQIDKEIGDVTQSIADIIAEIDALQAAQCIKPAEPVKPGAGRRTIKAANAT